MQDRNPISYAQYDETYFKTLYRGASTYGKADIHYAKMARFAAGVKFYLKSPEFVRRLFLIRC